MTLLAERAPRIRRTRLVDVAEVRWASIATVLFLAGLAVQLSPAPTWAYWVFYLGCYVAGGWEPATEGLAALRARTLDVDLLMIVAALGAACIGQIFDGALLIVIFATSGALEAVLTRRTSDSIRSLLDLAPEVATVVSDDGQEHPTPADEIRKGDVLVIRPGERIPGDGTVGAGGSEVDQSSITGESLPVFKALGDEVFAGTVNGTGVLRVRVEKDPSNTVVARIARMVEDAAETKAKKQLFVDRVEQFYSSAVVASTALIFAVPLLLGVDLRDALLRAMTFMIVASPCAVVLATMPPLLAAMATAGRRGVLVKSAIVMEDLRRTRVVAFDKTGTLTEGALRVARIERLGDHDDNEVLRLAASVEVGSEHPIAGAIVAAARDRGLVLTAVEDFRSSPGAGVVGIVDGVEVTVAKPTAGLDAGVAVIDLESGGMTAVVVRADGVLVGAIGLVDAVRPAAPSAVRDVGALTGAPPVLVTGDNRSVADSVARTAGISDVRFGLLPDEKVDAVRSLVGPVMLVGDGVNDAPALAAADIGVAMGRRGSDLALETADVVLLRDDLGALTSMIALSRRAHRIVVANLVIAALFIVVLVAWDLFGTLPLPVGVAGHESSTVLVALNGMRLLSSRAWRDSSATRAGM